MRTIECFATMKARVNKSPPARLVSNGMGISDDLVDADAGAANDYTMLGADADDTDVEMHEIRRSKL